jgi:hypothetical protein
MMQQFGGSLNAKSIKPMAMAARSAASMVKVVAPQVGIVSGLDVAIGFYDALNNYIETGSLLSAALTFVSSMISSIPIICSILADLTKISYSEGGYSLVIKLNPILILAPADAFAWSTCFACACVCECVFVHHCVSAGGADRRLGRKYRFICQHCRS